MRRRRVLTSFCLYRIDPIPIVARRGYLKLLTALNVQLTWLIVRHFLQSYLEKGEDLTPLSGSIGLQSFYKALHQLGLGWDKWQHAEYLKDTRWLVFPFDTGNIEFAGGKTVFDVLPGSFTHNDRSPILLRGPFQARAKIDCITHDCIGEA